MDFRFGTENLQEVKDIRITTSFQHVFPRAISAAGPKVGRTAINLNCNGKNDDDDDDDDRPFYQQPVESYSTTIIVLGMTKLMKWENPQRYPWQNPLYPQWLNCMAKPMKWENPQRYPWQNPLHRQRLNCMAKPMTWEIPLGCYGKSHGIKISILNVGGQCHQGSLMLQNQLFWPIFHYYWGFRLDKDSGRS